MFDRGAFKLAVEFEMKQEIKHLTTLERWDMFIWIMGCELFDPAEIGLNRAILQTFKVDKAGEILIPTLAGDYVI